MKLLKLFALFLLIFSGIRCSSEEESGRSPSPLPPPDRGSIVFIVTDSTTGDPVPGVSIVLDLSHESWTATSIHGVGIISNIPVGEYTARFYASGYENLEREVTVEKEEHIEEVSLMPLPFPDTVAPQVVAYDEDGADLWLIFSEAMDTLSFDTSSVSGRWQSVQPCDYHNVDTSCTFSMHWIHSNILQIDHAESLTWFCHSGNGLEKVKTPWRIIRIRIDSTVRDMYGNRLRNPFYYEP